MPLIVHGAKGRVDGLALTRVTLEPEQRLVDRDEVIATFGEE